jgi:micrococcal nuclease
MMCEQRIRVKTDRRADFPFPAGGRTARLLALALVVLVLVTPACDDIAPPSPGSGDTPVPAAGRTEARVVDVVDGDTIKVDVDGQVYTVRYIGIDTPETVHPDEPVEWMGPEASEANRRLVEGRIVYLETDVSETDQYGRLLRYVYLADGRFVNAELVRLGYAHAVTFPPDVKYQELLLEMQQEAREAGRGLWASPQPTG